MNTDPSNLIIYLQAAAVKTKLLYNNITLSSNIYGSQCRIFFKIIAKFVLITHA